MFDTHHMQPVQIDGVKISDTPKGLKAINDPDCAAAIWQRRPADRFQHWIDALPAEHLPHTRMIIRPERVRDALVELCQTCGTPDCDEATMLADDGAALAAMFAAVMAAPYLRLRLDVVTTNACRKFHIDALTARLICTYRGTGTQLGTSRDGTDPQDVHTVSTGSALVLRGTDWPAIPNPGLLHRSPPIEGTGETRLLLVIDPVFTLSDEADRQTIH